MTDVAIRCEGLAKQYRIGEREPYKALRDVITDAFISPFRRFRSAVRHSSNGSTGGEKRNIWALNDVSFEIKRGEVVGIVGRNGAGKSTLLKILSRITEPTQGRADIWGRVGSLLEVGTGFHPELTGRDNIFLNGAILGMRRFEVARKFDEIVAFAEVEKFIDTPVKRYSSGMYVRLAFAVAAHLEPEILVLDEVLSVGDTAFQKKCLGKMDEVARAGRTVLLVSHNMAAVQNFCRKTVYLAKGEVQFVGDTEVALSRYLDPSTTGGGGDLDLSRSPARSPGSIAIIKGFRMLNGEGVVTDRFTCGESVNFEFLLEPSMRLPAPQLGIGVNDHAGGRLFSLTTELSKCQLLAMDAPCRVTCSVQELPLAPGRYLLSLGLSSHRNTPIDMLEHVASFEVEGGDFFGTGHLPPAVLGRVFVRSAWRARAGQN